MHRSCLIIFVMSYLFFSVFLEASLVSLKASAGTIRVPTDYPTIQEGINHASAGDVILVLSGTYYEHVIVNKTVSFFGENSKTTILDGSKTGTVFSILANDVEISGFTIRNSGSGETPEGSGIKLSPAQPVFQNAKVHDNIIMNNSIGIDAENSNNNTFTGNVFLNNVGPPWHYIFDPTTGQFVRVGSENDISLLECNNSVLSANNATVRLDYSSNNSIADCSDVFLSSSDANTAKNCSDVVSLDYSNGNTVAECLGSVSLLSSNNNTITGCLGQIELEGSNDNIITGNKLSPGNSIEQSSVHYNNESSSCLRNIIIENTLLNGSIRLHGSYAAFAAHNSIANNTLVGGGIEVSGSHNVISQNNISGASIGAGVLFITPSNENNTVSKNSVMNSTTGIVVDSANSQIEDNLVQFSDVGLYVSHDNSKLSNNTISNCTYGLNLGSTENKLRNNRITGSNWSLITDAAAENDIDTTNTIDGDPIYYLVNQSNLEIGPSSFPRIGYLGLVNCSNVKVHDLTLTRNGEGIKLIQCNNCSVERTMIRNNRVGILIDSNYTVISHSVIQENYQGIQISGYYNSIEDNTIVNNTIRLAPYRFPEDWPSSFYNPFMHWMIQDFLGWYSGGIIMVHADSTTVIGNNVTNNEQGILLSRSSFNVFRNNSMVDNFANFGVDPSILYPPEWAISEPSPQEISPFLMNDVDQSNKVNGKPIYWWINRHDEQLPADAGYLVLVNSSGLIVNNLELQNNVEGMLLIGVNDTVISNNTVVGSSYGILMRPTIFGTAFNNTLSYNNFTANGVGISVDAANCTIFQNLIDKNAIGVYTRGDYTSIIENTITRNALPPREEWILEYDPPYLTTELFLYPVGSGIILESSNDTVRCNLIQENEAGIGPGGVTRTSSDNWIYHNSFINNTVQTYLASVYNWDDGYPSGGNYWSNHDGVDLNSDPYQNQTGSDGIGDTPHRAAQEVVPRILPPEEYERFLNQYDRYPLAAPISIWNVGNWNNTLYSVDVVSNSSISSFYFNPSATKPFISFSVSGDVGTAGFCRITIPKQLLWVNDRWNITVEGQTVKYTLFSDENNAYLMFNYTLSVKTVQVTGDHAIPEFTSLITPLGACGLSTLLKIMVHRRKHSRPRSFPR